MINKWGDKLCKLRQLFGVGEVETGQSTRGQFLAGHVLGEVGVGDVRDTSGHFFFSSDQTRLTFDEVALVVGYFTQQRVGRGYRMCVGVVCGVDEGVRLIICRLIHLLFYKG